MAKRIVLTDDSTLEPPLIAPEALQGPEYRDLNTFTSGDFPVNFTPLPDPTIDEDSLVTPRTGVIEESKCALSKEAQEAISKALKGIEEIRSAIDTAIAFIEESVSNLVSTVISSITSLITGIYNAIRSFIASIMDGIKEASKKIYDSVATQTSATFKNKHFSSIRDCYSDFVGSVEAAKTFDAHRESIGSEPSAVADTSSITKSLVFIQDYNIYVNEDDPLLQEEGLTIIRS